MHLKISDGRNFKKCYLKQCLLQWLISNYACVFRMPNSCSVCDTLPTGVFIVQFFRQCHTRTDQEQKLLNALFRLNVEWKHFVIQTHFSDAVCGFNWYKFPVTILQPCLLKLPCNSINLVFCGITYKSPCISTVCSLYTARDNLAAKTSTYFPAIATLLYVLDVLDWVNQANYSECSNTECRECAQPCCGV